LLEKFNKEKTNLTENPQNELTNLKSKIESLVDKDTQE
jgi:hypothetical protein